MKRAVFAGTFDPFTIGHYDIVARACELFDEVVIAVADNMPGGRNSLDVKLREEIAKISTAKLTKAKVVSFTGLLSGFMTKADANVIVRGLRNCSDFEYERDLCEVYKSQNENIECVYLMSRAEHTHVSATAVRQLTLLNGNIDDYVCRSALGLIEKYYGV